MQNNGYKSLKVIERFRKELQGLQDEILDEETGEIIGKNRPKKIERLLAELDIPFKEIKNGILQNREPLDIVNDIAKNWGNLKE